jgi:hypothetical protein
MHWIAINSVGAMLVAFAFGRKFHGIVGRVLDLLIFLAGLLSALPCLLLLSKPDVAWFVGTWVIAWQGAYHIGNIEQAKIRWGVLASWIIVLTLILIRLGNQVLENPLQP